MFKCPLMLCVCHRRTSTQRNLLLVINTTPNHDMHTTLQSNMLQTHTKQIIGAFKKNQFVDYDITWHCLHHALIWHYLHHSLIWHYLGLQSFLHAAGFVYYGRGFRLLMAKTSAFDLVINIFYYWGWGYSLHSRQWLMVSRCRN